MECPAVSHTRIGKMSDLHGVSCSKSYIVTYTTCGILLNAVLNITKLISNSNKNMTKITSLTKVQAHRDCFHLNVYS